MTTEIEALVSAAGTGTVRWAPGCLRHTSRAGRPKHIGDPQVAGEFVDQLSVDVQDDTCPPEVRSLGRTIVRWRDQIVAWHEALVSNGPTEAINNRNNRIKRIGFGFRRFAYYRIRVLLYAGKPNCDLLPTGLPTGTPR